MTALAPTNAPIVPALSDEPLLTENARKVLEARYLKKNEAGEITEAPSSLFRRVARTIGEVESLYGASDTERRHWEDRFYTLMTSGAFMPNSPTLMNAGRELGMLSACFVLPVRDSINDIFDAIKHTAMIQKAGGGTGFAFDELRPTGDYIQSSGGTTSGPISFWRAFSEATNAIQQGAFRRGANMGMMYIHHPDILKFLHAKQDLSQFTNYNISVKITDAWMDEFLADGDLPHICRNPRNGRAFVLPRDLDIWKYDIRSLVEVTEFVSHVVPETRECYYTSPRLVKLGEFRARFAGQAFYTRRDIWNIIVKNAHQTGEPGVVFMDRINEANPTPQLGRMESTNPCGEQPLLPYEACNLGSINLGVFITNALTPAAGVDWETLRDAVHLSIRFLDNVIDANNYVLPEIDSICKGNRKIGLGIMGFADALYKLGVAYNSEDGVLWGERFMKFVNDESHKCSEHLARCRGCFPNWKGSSWQTRHNRMMRNACSTTVAPTGTISIIANCSGGIEPMFSLAFIRNVLRGQKQGEKPLVEVNDTFLEVAHKRGFFSDALLERIAREGTLAHIDEIPADVKQVFVCAHDITPDWHMKMQAAFQRHCDSSISKTINFPHEASGGDVERIYRLAYEMRCKGVTVYRDGCRDFQPMALTGSAGVSPASTAKSEPAAQARDAESPAAAVQLPADPAPMPLAARSEPQSRPHSPADLPIAAIAAQPSAPAPRPAAPALPITLSEVQAQTRIPAPDLRPPPPAATPSLPAVPAAFAAAGFIPPAPAVVAPAARPNGAGHGPPARDAAPRDPAPAESKAPAQKLRVEPAAPPAPAVRRPLEPQDLPEIVSGLRIRQATPFGNMHVKITVDPRADRELEVFAQLGKGGDVATSDLEAICRMISLWLRAGGSINLVIKQLEGIGSSLQIPTRSGRIMSLGDGLACALKKYTSAKSRFGLRPLLLGEIDPADMDNPNPPPHHSPSPGGTRPGHGDHNGNGGHQSQSDSQPPLRTDGTQAAPAAAPAHAHSAAPAPVGGSLTAAPAFSAAVLNPESPSGALDLVNRLDAFDHADATAIDARTIDERAALLADRLDVAAAPDIVTLTPQIAAQLAAAPPRPARAAAPRPAPPLDARLLSESQAQARAAADPREVSAPGRPESNGRAADAADPDADPGVISLLDEATDQESEQAQLERYARLNALAEIMAEDDPNAAGDTRARSAARSHDTNGDTFILRSGHDSALHYKICCPQCDGHLTMQEGCRKCHNCGWAAC